MLFLSPRYSLAGHAHLVESTGCKTMLAPCLQPAVTTSITEACKLRVYRIPEVDELWSHEYRHFVYDKSFEQARAEPLVVLHTSGTTGLPKPVIWTHDWAASFATQLAETPAAGYESLQNMMLSRRIVSLLPCFHVNNAAALFGCDHPVLL